GVSSLLSRVNLSADANLSISLESLTESLGAASAEGGDAETSFMAEESDEAETSFMTEEEGSETPSDSPPPYPEQHLPPLYFDKKDEIDGIFRENFSSFIKQNSNGEELLSVRNPMDIIDVWKTLLDTFPEYIEERDVVTMLFLISRETMTGKPLLLDFMIDYIDALAIREATASDVYVNLPRTFFGVNVRGITPASHINVLNYSTYAFWSDESTNSFGFMEASNLRNYWHFWSLTAHSMSYRVQKWEKIEKLNLYVFGKFE
ncbi:MAG: hypothetical protein OXD32_05800, partial [Endozoicomonadaceae bacterium]|nr:hypothetical protein [Endozoicomonadaceae bacterium]